MTLQLYNTYTKQLEEFQPLNLPEVNIYNCGPTVYSHPHIGNFRSFIFADTLRRYLEYSGYKVKQVMNITDVGHLTLDAIDEGEDKMEEAAKREKKDPWQIAEFYIKEFFELLKKLNLRKADIYPRATEHIKEQLELAKKLVEKGYAYVVPDTRNVYFDVTKFKKYGKLSGNTLEQLQAGARIEVNPEKHNPLDFAIWKQDNKHIMKWENPWGQDIGLKGFPGWHLECSAMSMKYLGETIDIHTGGEDNIFPHHESEIAQSEATTGKLFVKYWLHVRHLLVNGKKMSKSESNFYTVKDIFEKGYDAITLRYALLSAHYRQPLNFTFEGLESAKSAVDRLLDFKKRVEKTYGSGESSDLNEQATASENQFKMAMDDDLNISEALSAIFNFINYTNRLLDQGIGGAVVLRAIKLLRKLDSVIGILEMQEEEELGEEEKLLVKEREEARKRKDFATADKIRDELKAKGILLEDTPQGTSWKRIR